MAEQRDDAVSKGGHGAWPIHSHSVFPVKYRKSRRDEVVTTVTPDTAAESAKWNDQPHPIIRPFFLEGQISSETDTNRP